MTHLVPHTAQLLAGNGVVRCQAEDLLPGGGRLVGAATLLQGISEVQIGGRCIGAMPQRLSKRPRRLIVPLEPHEQCAQVVMGGGFGRAAFNEIPQCGLGLRGRPLLKQNLASSFERRMIARIFGDGLLDLGPRRRRISGSDCQPGFEQTALDS